jgi:hypothetical protein
MTTNDTRTEAERRYDAERSGQLYVRPIVDDEQAIAEWIDTPISEAEERIIRDRAILQEAHRRWPDNKDIITLLERLNAGEDAVRQRFEI